MKATAAIREFINKGPSLREDLIYLLASVSELREMKQITSAEEWQELGRQACNIMGLEFEQVEVQS